MRKITRQIKVGPHLLGGGAPILIQSMTTTNTADREKTLFQIATLVDAGSRLAETASTDASAEDLTLGLPPQPAYL